MGIITAHGIIHTSGLLKGFSVHLHFKMGASTSKAALLTSKALTKSALAVPSMITPAASATFAQALDSVATSHYQDGTRPRSRHWRGTFSDSSANAKSQAAGNDLYSGGSSGDEDDHWQNDPTAASMLNQLAGSIKQRGSTGGAEHTGPVEIPQIRRKEMPPDLRERVNVDDLRGLFKRVQQETLSGRDFDSDTEAKRLGMDAATLRNAIKFTSLPLIQETKPPDYGLT